jgi:hypothetical protein
VRRLYAGGREARPYDPPKITDGVGAGLVMLGVVE